MGKENSSLLGNGIVGILSETVNMWERRTPLCPSHCARLLHSGKMQSGIERIIVQPSTKRVHHDSQYEDVGCEISDDLSQCGLILGVKQPKMEMILPDRAYAFFSHTHKAQTENMPLLDKVLAERVSLFDYELIVGDDGKRLIAFGMFAGRAGLIDFLHGLGQRYLSLGYSTPFLSLGASHMYSSLAAAKAAVIAVGEEIATQGLPSRISPLVFVFTGSGNVSRGAQEIFRLLPHTFVDACQLPDLFKQAGDLAPTSRSTKRVFQVYGCVVTCQDMVAPKDPAKTFDKDDYYAHPEHYDPVFHEKIAPYASVIVNCMYWEKRFPRLLSTKQLQELMKRGCPLLGISDITCDVGGSMEFVNRPTSIERPFFRYDPSTDSYHDNMEGDGILCLAVDILPTEFSKEASRHFGDILSHFIGTLASSKNIADLPSHLQRACIAHGGALTPLFEYIPRMRNSSSIDSSPNPESAFQKKYNTLVSLSGHLFDQFLINDALDIIEANGGSFRLVKCEVGQSANVTSYSEVEVGADDLAILNRIIDSLSSVAHSRGKVGHRRKEELSLNVGKISDMAEDNGHSNQRPAILILGAGRVCRPAAEFLASAGSRSSDVLKKWQVSKFEEIEEFKVIVGSLYLKDAEETIEGIPNATAIQLDAMDNSSLAKYIPEVQVVLSLLPPSFHTTVANACIEHKKHLVTASYVDDSMSKLDSKAKDAGVTILGEMGLDPGIDHMMAMKMIDQAHVRSGKIKAFNSYCCGLPSPAAANNPLAYKFSWNPAGAIRSGRNSATYKHSGEIIQIDGDGLYDSAVRYRLPDLPAFALEYLPNRNSLVYGDLYGISNEASTIFRATLRYEGFSEIMSTLAKIGLFDTEVHTLLNGDGKRPTYGAFLCELLKCPDTSNSQSQATLMGDAEMVERIILLGHCKEASTALKTLKTTKFLGLHENKEIPGKCSSAFDVTCLLMEERLAYSSNEQDMVLLHHEIQVEYPDDENKPTEIHRATLLEFGRMENGRNVTSMALTVGIPAGIGALLLFQKKIHRTGVIRPLQPEVYEPALDILESYGLKVVETVEIS
ncbi:Saccharopine dehydrogenase (NAD(+) L-glutamate-forming) protein [Dioscorea alata]|uniref:Saccharopine dehydrogenase (NAD(+) L-glutamate-forming) protein n=1 Tax=Dioscorea alata TaxID=55571 RepID=A0ACB7VZ27_DIOAL|nr:Saccharopine dehydrogenase (NAD(+) L-glutamate-forming) protein [Dioscorea alata]